MKVDFVVPAFGNANFPDVHIPLSELKKAQKDNDEMASLQRIQGMICRFVDAPEELFDEQLLDYVVKQISSKGELVISVRCENPNTYHQGCYLLYFAIADNIAREIKVGFNE